MHDIGIIVFGYLITSKYSDFLKNSRDEEVLLYEQEKKEFGVDHAEIGALFIDKWWGMDKRISQSVGHNHSSIQGKDIEYYHEKLVQIANCVCNNQGLTNGTNFIPDVIKGGFWEEIDIPNIEEEIILNEVQSSIEQAEEIIGMLHN